MSSSRIRLTPEDLQHEIVDMASLHLHPENARRHAEGVLKESVDLHGVYRSIVVSSDGYVLAGNGTYEAAKAAGDQRLWVGRLPLKHTDDQALEIVLVDNAASDRAGYDDVKLAALLARLPDPRIGTGFDEQRLKELLARLKGRKPGNTEPDSVSALPKKARSKTGDRWILGEHRLMVGDATKDIPALMGDERADLVWTDPPYGVSYVGKTKAALTIKGDDAGDAAMSTLITESFRAIAAVTKAGGSAYIAHPDTRGTLFREAFEDAGFELKQVLVWVKQTFVMGRQDYQWQHEPILYGWRPGAAHRWFGGFTRTTVLDDDLDPEKLSKTELLAMVKAIREATTVLREDRPMRSILHPTMKPVSLVARLLDNSSAPGDIVLDPFGGAGSTLIAAERTSRRARLLEIDPIYADVIVRRFQEHTGIAPILEATGKPVDFVG